MYCCKKAIVLVGLDKRWNIKFAWLKVTLILTASILLRMQIILPLQKKLEKAIIIFSVSFKNLN